MAKTGKSVLHPTTGELVCVYYRGKAHPRVKLDMDADCQECRQCILMGEQAFQAFDKRRFCLCVPCAYKVMDKEDPRS